MRLIDADALKKNNGRLLHCDFPHLSEMTLEELIDEAPTIDAVPARHGKWLHPEEDDEDYHSVSCSCSVCGWKFNYYEDDIDGAPYCAVCGAKMDIVSPLYQREGAEP